MSDKDHCRGIYIAWHPFQQRTYSLAQKLGVEPCWFHYDWEKHNKFIKLFAYLVKGISTILLCVRYSPKQIFVQLPPVPVLYAVYFYSVLANKKIVYDCHNSLFCSHWIRWPFVKGILNSCRSTVVTHNDDIAKIALSHGYESMVLLDPLPERVLVKESVVLPKELVKKGYVIVPFSFSDDEPIDALLDAAIDVPDMIFVITWFEEKARNNVSREIPKNIVFTGFLDIELYKSVFSNAICALALTTREGTQPSVATEAISFGVPLIVSDLATTRKLYDKWPIYVDNEADSIATGLRQALDIHDELLIRMQSLYSHIESKHNEQFSLLTKRLSL